MSLDEIRAHLTVEQENEPGYLYPARAADWAALPQIASDFVDPVRAEVIASEEKMIEAAIASGQYSAWHRMTAPKLTSP